MPFPRSSHVQQPPDPAAIRRPRFLASVPESPGPWVRAFSRHDESATVAEEAPSPMDLPALEELDVPDAAHVAEKNVPLPSIARTPGPPRPAAPPAPSYEPPIDAGLISRVVASVERLRSESERLAEQARADALEIGFQVARRILETELSASAEPLFALVRSAVRRAGESRTLTLRLHPADKELIEQSGGAERIDVLLAAKLKLAADPSLSRGDCMVDADFASVDGRLDTRFAQLERSVGRALAEGRTR
ncbi:FliH/SctL family protein [Vulgatibacter incomptus]|uniref:Flagellar assembly protein FliH n=1 Tax=Vulgatibacter incomptus TaxID=1391653 RepID=A0A0K1PHZ2_9BACT|nr:FliH/SctL family protein [Vulgatibacter incomptus]AKU93026.1 Flagellar assembly protein FliH [Vulgatibacter incomptus]